MTMAGLAPTHRILTLLTAAAVAIGSTGLLLAAGEARAQGDDNPVYVDDSPRAWELFRRARDQAETNPGEAARLYQELLDEYALKLLPRGETMLDHLTAVRSRVHEALLSQPRVLERYRQMQTPSAERLLDAGSYEQLILTRFLTEPALEASIREAQRAVESARFQRAIQLLDEASNHPDLTGRRAAYRWLFLGLAANAIERTELRNRAIRALADANDPVFQQCHSELTRLLQSGPGPERRHGLTVLDIASTRRLETLSEQPIWTSELENSLLRRRFPSASFEDRGDSAEVEASRLRGDLLTAAPTVAGRTVYVNEGQVIRAFDRFSQREFWRTQIGSASTVSRNIGGIGDLNIVAVSGDRVITITGHAGGQVRTGSDRVVCLDARDGRVIWTQRFERLLGREEFEGLYPHGAPAVADGTVYVLARKVTTQSLMSTYAVALDLYATDDAERVRWVQYVASSGGLQQTDTRPYSSIVYDRGEVFVATPIGAVACLDGVRGQMRWLQRLETPFRISPNNMPWEMIRPIVAGERVVALGPDQRTVHFLDRTTGGEVQRVDARNWGSPRYLLGWRNYIYAIGNDVQAILLDAPQGPVWSLNDQRPDDLYYDMRGRVQVTDGTLVIPTRHGVALCDAETGEVLRLLDIPAASNPLATGEELYVATSDSLQAYMPIAVAERMLRDQIEQHPGNPQPALSLLRIAARAEDSTRAVELAMEASEIASAALAGVRDAIERTRAQIDLFDSLVRIADRADEVEHDLAASLHDRIGEIASTPSQRIEHLLARGSWLVNAAGDRNGARLAEGMRSYQAVLSTPELARADLRQGKVIRPAADVAAARLAEVVERHGREAYRPLAEEATRKFIALRDSDDPAALRALATEYPFADVARDARLRAARLLIERDRPFEAMSTLAAVYDALPSDADADAEAVLATILDLAMNRNWRAMARFWLARAVGDFGPRRVTLAAGSRTVEELRRELAVPAAAPSRIGEIDVEPKTALRTFQGILLPRYDEGVPRPPDAAYVLQGRELSKIRAADLSVAWTVELPDAQAELLRAEGSRLVLWLRAAGGQMLVLNANDGTTEFVTDPMRAVLFNLQLPVRRRAVSGFDVRGGRERIDDALEPLPLVDHEGAVFVGRSGGMLRIDYASRGRTVRWEGDHPLNEVHFAAGHDLGVVLAGVARDDDAAGGTSGRVVVIDPETGDVRRSFKPRHGETPRWLVVTDGGQAIYGSAAGIEAIDLLSAERRWANISDPATWMYRAWTGGELLAAADEATQLRLIDPRTGRISDVLQPAGDGQWQPQELRHVHIANGRLAARYERHVAWFTGDGAFRGRDSIATEENFVFSIPTADRMVAISHVRDPDAFRDRRRGGAGFVNVVFQLSENGRLLGDAVQVASDHRALHDAEVIDGWILVSLSDSGQTAAIPAPPAE